MPYDGDTDTEQVAWIQDVLQFQSTLAYLKNPPPSYPLPAVDLVGGLDNISTSIANEDYTNEYDIEVGDALCVCNSGVIHQALPHHAFFCGPIDMQNCESIFPMNSLTHDFATARPQQPSR